MSPRGRFLLATLAGLVLAGLVWAPFVLVGHLLAGPVRRRIRPEAVRRGVLVFCVIASIGVISRALI